MRIPFFSCLLLSTSQLAPKQICFLLTFLFQISSFSYVSGQCLDDQRSLLLQLNSTLIYNPSSSSKLVQWNQNIDCCNWYGVECDNIGHVIGLELYDESIYGPIPSIIGNLSKLTHIDLSNNNLNGSLSSTHFEGLSNLQSLYLNGNSLKGNIPTSLVILPSLQVLWLSDNKFSGQVNEFPTLNSNLETLQLQRNQLEGLIPKSFFILPSLRELHLSDNKFSGQVNEFPTLNSSLVRLYLQRNQLEGLIPTSLFILPSLQVLWLFDNKFSGQVNEFPTLNSSLVTLYLDRNQLEGLIPKSFFILPSLRELWLSDNKFSGQVNEFPTLNSSLVRLYLQGNQLEGLIPTSLFILPSLQVLWLFDNKFSSQVNEFPTLNSNLQTDLIDLDLSNNKISGDIPSWIWEVGNGSLYNLNLSHNFLMNLQTPYKIPSSIHILDLHSNMLRGELPVVQRLPWYVDYSNNHFQGHIPIDIGIFVDEPLFFSVANNNLTGEIPISLCNAVNIEVLDLSNNSLSGRLPPCLVKKITQLRVLNIGRNNISGSIPDTFHVDCSLSTLDLSMNNLRGNIPPSLANCKSLQVMNVASNNLNGTFPCILMNLSRLHVLLLRSNKFFGDIRCPGLGHILSNLQIIDIAFNSFTGFLDSGFISSWSSMKLKNSPRLTGDPLGFSTESNYSYHQDKATVYQDKVTVYQDKVTVTLKGLELEFVKIFTVLTSIDFSSNKFQGAIPETFGELNSLHVLNLSHNSFTGTLPKSLGNLTNLESLDLSANQLTGNIPTELVSLIFLSFFDVSYNELVGRIPSGRQFETFSAASYEGNAGLCGLPTNQSCGSYIPKETSTTSTGEKDVDWMFMLAGLGYATGVALVVVPPLFSRLWGERWDELQVKFLRLICPRFRS